MGLESIRHDLADQLEEVFKKPGTGSKPRFQGSLLKRCKYCSNGVKYLQEHQSYCLKRPKASKRRQNRPNEKLRAMLAFKKKRRVKEAKKAKRLAKEEAATKEEKRRTVAGRSIQRSTAKGGVKWAELLEQLRQGAFLP